MITKTGQLIYIYFFIFLLFFQVFKLKTFCHTLSKPVKLTKLKLGIHLFFKNR